MKAYQVKAKKLPGTNYSEVHRKALKMYSRIKKQSKRRPYLKSAYFKKDKIFLGLFWHHLRDKSNLKDKTKRISYFPCALELIKHSRFTPTSKENPNKKSEILHRFFGKTPDKELFCVQIKENKYSKQKHLMSIFPYKKKGLPPVCGI